MSLGDTCTVYEHLAETELALEGIRPGGLGLTERALTWCDFPPNCKILDVGCGSGVTLNRLIVRHGFSAIGIDASSHLLDQAHSNNPALVVVRAAGENLPFPDECADGVFAECSLSVMYDPGRALDEFRRVLRIGGKLILSDVYARNPENIPQLACVPTGCCLRGAISRAELFERLTRRDFRIDLWEDHTDLLTQFSVQLIFSYGSMSQFWLKAGSNSVDPEQMKRTIAEAKPGYFLLIAQKSVGYGTMKVGTSQ
ncbi:MAG: DVU_1556 family methyltransferase [Desulfomonilaceae bacterium]